MTAEERQLRREEVRSAVAATWQVDWSEFTLLPALRCLPGMAILLLLGLHFHNVGAGVMASSGALTVGFGSFYRFRWSRSAPMLLAALGITVAAFFSSLIGHTPLGFTLIAFFWAYLCGLLQVNGGGVWWISLQCVIFALIASNYPVGLGDTLTHTLLALGGALLEMLCIVLLWRLAGTKPSVPDTEIPFSLDAIKESLAQFRAHLHTHRSPATRIGRSALRLAVTVGLAAALSRLLPLRNGYWMPMTALIVMTLDWRQTFTKSLARLAGTLAGGGLATLLAVSLRPGPLTLIALVLTFALLSYLFLRVNYAIYAIFITAYVVFQLASIGLPAADLIPARILYTALGGALALVVQLLWCVPPAGTEDLPASERGCA